MGASVDTVNTVVDVYGTIRHEIRIRRPAADVWALAGDATKLHHWFPGIVNCTVDGTTRIITTGTGIPMLEEILVCDNTQRRFQYRLNIPIIKHHRGTIDVIDLDDNTCLVVYSTECDPRTMALVIGGGTAGALAELKRQMEGHS
jgi:Polyketide cyclase / dehydrase and lipid transport